MSDIHLRRSDPTVSQLLRATFPEWTGKHIIATVSSTVRFTNTQWDSGYRRCYQLVRLADMQTVQIEEAPFLQQSELHTKEHTIPDGFVVVVHVHGRWEHVEIIAPASCINPMLPAPTELTDDEKTVLIATRCLKSSYAGIPNYRFREAARSRGITLERWEAAKASLIEKKFLNKAGAITVEGRNVCPSDGYL